MAHKNPVGRPKSAPNRKRSLTITSRFTEPEGALIRAAAAEESARAEARVTPSSLVRRIVVAHFAAELRAASDEEAPYAVLAA